MDLIVQAPLRSTLGPPNPLPPDIQVWRDSTGAVCAYGYRGGDGWVLDFPGVAAYRFMEKGRVVALPYPGASRTAIVDIYQRSVRQLVIQARGMEVLHASAVVAGDVVVALCGESESGKSTLAYALGQRGYAVWADDTVAFHIRKETVLAIPQDFSIRLRPMSARYFELGPPNGKIALRMPRFPRGRGVRPLGTVFVLNPSPSSPDSRVDVVPLAPVEAFMALLPHLFCFSLKDAERKSRMLQHYLALADGIPVYLIRFRPELDRIESVINAIEEWVQRSFSTSRTMTPRQDLSAERN